MLEWDVEMKTSYFRFISALPQAWRCSLLFSPRIRGIVCWHVEGSHFTTACQGSGNEFIIIWMLHQIFMHSNKVTLFG